LIMLRSRRMRVHFSCARIFPVRFARPLEFYLVAILPHLKQGARYEKPLCQAHNMKFRDRLSPFVSNGLPEKTIAKSFVPLITYPHSGPDHLEKRPFTKLT